MSILTYMKSIPLFTTPLEAIAWGRQRGLTGYHSHTFNIRTGYMGGSNHKQAMKKYTAPVRPTPATTPQPVIPPTTTTTTTTTPPPTSGGGGGGY